MSNFPSEDRPEPSEQAIRARVPDRVAGGAFSTGVIVITAQTEFILDFVQNLGRPHQIVARVVMPHHVLPQLVDALHRNIELYRGRWGDLPQTGVGIARAAALSNQTPRADSASSGVSDSTAEPAAGESKQNSPAVPSSPLSEDKAASNDEKPADDAQTGKHGWGSGSNPPAGEVLRHTSVQAVYDDLKVRDEFLSGAYANAVMIGHGPHEFSFDFITNFYPHSAVSSRVFMAAGQVPSLFESLKGTWGQMKNRMPPPPGSQPPDSDNS